MGFKVGNWSTSYYKAISHTQIYSLDFLPTQREGEKKGIFLDVFKDEEWKNDLLAAAW